MELIFPALLLAAASDSEGGNEEAWTEQFRVADEKRKKIGIPLLTSKEKMRILLGVREMFDGMYIVGFQLGGSGKIHLWNPVIFRCQKLKTSFVTQEVLYRGPQTPHDIEDDCFTANEAVLVLAKELLIASSGQVSYQGQRIHDDETLRFPW
jgi:hypothetical protein